MGKLVISSLVLCLLLAGCSAGDKQKNTEHHAKQVKPSSSMAIGQIPDSNKAAANMVQQHTLAEASNQQATHPTTQHGTQMPAHGSRFKPMPQGTRINPAQATLPGGTTTNTEGNKSAQPTFQMKPMQKNGTSFGLAPATPASAQGSDNVQQPSTQPDASSQQVSTPTSKPATATTPTAAAKTSQATASKPTPTSTQPVVQGSPALPKLPGATATTGTTQAKTATEPGKEAQMPASKQATEETPSQQPKQSSATKAPAAAPQPSIQPTSPVTSVKPFQSVPNQVPQQEATPAKDSAASSSTQQEPTATPSPSTQSTAQSNTTKQPPKPTGDSSIENFVPSSTKSFKTVPTPVEVLPADNNGNSH